jgi:hypothetical protein
MRGLHWSVTVMSLTATILMTCVRTWTRRGLGTRLRCLPLPPEEDSLPWNALFVEQSFSSVEGSRCWQLKWPQPQEWPLIEGKVHNRLNNLPAFAPLFEGITGAFSYSPR